MNPIRFIEANQIRKDNAMQKEMKLLGFKAKDKITGFSGIITSVSFDLFGCIQVVISPPIDKDGKTREGHWFDTNRLEVTSKTAVMKCRHNFERDDTGSADKPMKY